MIYARIEKDATPTGMFSSDIVRYKLLMLGPRENVPKGLSDWSIQEELADVQGLYSKACAQCVLAKEGFIPISETFFYKP